VKNQEANDTKKHSPKSNPQHSTRVPHSSPSAPTASHADIHPPTPWPAGASRSHVGFGVAAGAVGDFLQSGADLFVVAVVSTVDAEDDEAGGQAAEKFVVVEFV